MLLEIVFVTHFTIFHNHGLSCYELTDPHQAIDSHSDHDECYWDVTAFSQGGCNGVQWGIPLNF